MRNNHSFKKIAALVLSCVLALGAVPLSPLVEDAHAETTAAEPSAVAYATKDELEEIPTTDGADYKGDVTKVGRIKLGKNNIDAVMEWYILGSDPGVSGGKNNTAIFAASDMVTGLSQEFDSRYTSPFTHEYKNDGDMTYEAYDGAEPAEPKYVLFNHYGMSELRSTLKILATSQFSDAEQGIMQATTVDTPDYKANGTTTDSYLTEGAPRAVYTTSDVLYAAWGNPRYGDTTSVTEDKYAIGIDKTNIYIGSTSPNYKGGAGAKVINLANLGASTVFWLRPANAAISRNALVAKSNVACTKVYKVALAVRPASNLNLSSVIFASAASGASSNAAVAGTIKTTDGTDSTKDAMMLRLDGSGQNIGSVSTDAESGIITATKKATTGDVALVVQGRNADTDWYYSKPITSTTDETVTIKDDIVPALTGAGVTLEDTADDKAAQIDLTKCKIWLETPVEPSVAAEKQTLFYAVKAHTYNEWKSDGEHHWKECIDPDCPNPDEAKKNEEYYGEHKLDENGKCTVCNYDIDEKHDWIKVPRQEPTCTEVGYQQYWHCEDGYDVKYYAGSLGILVKFTDMSEIEIPATGHTADEAWHCNIIYHWHVCEVCSAKLTETRARHKFDGGRICTICAYERPYDSDSSDNNGSSSYTTNTSTAGSVTPDADGSWSRDEQGLRFEYADGSYAKGTVTTTTDGTSELQVAWEKVKGSWYAFDADGYAMQDWVYDASGKSWYYCDEDNGSQSGWLYTPVDNCWYYLDPNSGAMHTGWVTIDGRRYYFSEAHNGTYYQDPVTYKWVYANPDQNRPFGSMYVNTVTPDGSFVGADGACIE